MSGAGHPLPTGSPIISSGWRRTLDYSDFRDEGLRLAIFARSGGGKSSLAALFVEQCFQILIYRAFERL